MAVRLVHGLLLCCVIVGTSASAIPIWELLTQEEKTGRLFYIFIHLVKQYCSESDIPDCQKILTLYGMSNLLNLDNYSLDLMDPYQRNAKQIIWKKVTRGDFKLPQKDSQEPTSSQSMGRQTDEYSLNELDDLSVEVPEKTPGNFLLPRPTGQQEVPVEVRVQTPFLYEYRDSRQEGPSEVRVKPPADFAIRPYSPGDVAAPSNNMQPPEPTEGSPEVRMKPPAGFVNRPYSQEDIATPTEDMQFPKSIEGPPEVRVKPPAGFTFQESDITAEDNVEENEEDVEEGTGFYIIYPGRSSISRFKRMATFPRKEIELHLKDVLQRM